MFIGDGFGIAPKTAARMAMGQGLEGKRYHNDAGFHVLALDNLKFTGMATTHSLNSWTTDSAPGAAVYATGKKIDNEVISFDVVTNQSIETILEAAKKQGYAVGLVTTTRITHATPAAFGSHIWHRDLEEYIAAQLISSTQAQYEEIFNSSAIDSLKYKKERDWILPTPKVGVEIDVLLGGGAANFLPEKYADTIINTQGKPVLSSNKVNTLSGRRKDKVNLVKIAQKRGYQFINSREALLNVDIAKFKPKSKAKLLGLFKSSHISYEQDRQLNDSPEPTLADMTQIAIKVLKRKGGKKGFFLMVEGGRIDHLAHNNAGATTKACKFEVDSVAFPPDGGNERLRNTAQGNIYGSDYMIKEVLSFDFAVAEGRKLLNDTERESLLFSTSDHECGAVAVLGLYDSTHKELRTYVEEPTNQNKKWATPKDIKRGDIATNGYFPEYVPYQFQGRTFPKPKSPNGRRIIITYASNPLSLGHSCDGGYAFGNHTPQDIWVGADDNIDGKFAARITGKGMLDNTYLTNIMADFLGVKLGK
ncbi:MAG: alkaline phosphatase [Cytophagales bacterium]